jgi:hypothetical protein
MAHRKRVQAEMCITRVPTLLYTEFKGTLIVIRLLEQGIPVRLGCGKTLIQRKMITATVSCELNFFSMYMRSNTESL